MTPASDDAHAAAAAALLHAGGRAAAILARIGGAVGAAARAEAERLGALPRPARARALATRVAELRAPVPPGLPLVHRDWIDAALQGEGRRVRDILAGRVAVAPPVLVWIERRTYGGLAALPLPAEGAPLAPATLAHRPVAWIEATLRRAGLATLAHALAGAPRPAVAALAARLGPDGAALIAAVTAPPATEAAVGSRRAATRRAAGIAVGDDPLAVLAIGARAFAPHVAGDPAARLAQRLPRHVGLRLLAEVAAFADATDGPSWEALVA